MSTLDMRDIMQLLESQSGYQDGVYCSARPSQSTIDALRSFCAAYDIPNPVPATELHSTVIYSERGNSNFTHQETYESPIKAKFSGFEMFGEDKNVLVIKMKSRELMDRHNSLMDEFDLTFNFETYQPHITLSYDAAGFDWQNLDAYHGDLIFTGEDANELDRNWEPDDDIRET